MNLQLLLNFLGLGSSPQRRHEAQLRAMSDRELADLGIGRGQIPAVVSESRHPGLDPGSMPRRKWGGERGMDCGSSPQ